MRVPDLEPILAELDALANALAAEDTGPTWGQTHKLLLKAKADPGEVASVIISRDVAGLRALIRTLRGGTPPSPTTPSPDETPTQALDPELIKKAMRAFRKRLKLTRLDHESKLGVGPMTGGKKADFDAIMAPQEFPEEVWDTLVERGQLKRMGRGFYTLADE